MLKTKFIKTVIGDVVAHLRVSRQPVLDCGTIFHPDCGGQDFPSILADDL